MEIIDLRKRFGAEVKRRRIQMEISQEELGERASLHRTYVSDVEAGKRNLSLASMERLSRALGVSIGAVFCSAEDDTAMAVGSSRNEEAADSTADILLVEDDPNDVELTLNAFKKAKLTNRVRVARDGAEALDFLFRRGAYAKHRIRKQPQLVLLDFDLPKVPGLEVLRRLKADKRTRMIPVVVMTVLRKDPRCREATRLGAEGCLVKPLTFASFSHVMPKLSFGWALLRPEVRGFL